MKKNCLYLIFGGLSLLCGSCTMEPQTECPPCNNKAVEVQFAKGLPSAGFQTPLYVFRRAAGTQDTYVLERSYDSVADGAVLKLPLSELKSYDYRFMMIAQPDTDKWIALRTALGSPVVPGTGWSDLRLANDSGYASADGYCGFTDISGADLLAGGKVRVTLTRISGRMLFDFYRIGASLAAPESIVSPDVSSVIDRVKRIDISYDNVTSELRFDADNRLVASSSVSGSVKRIVEPINEAMKVILPQEENGLLIYDGAVRGSLRMEGIYMMPSDSKVRVNLLFTYLDTTPFCGNNHTGDHVEGCFAERQLKLSLPAATSVSGLPVVADSFTVNRAGIRTDRIIDVPVAESVEVDFAWK